MHALGKIRRSLGQGAPRYRFAAQLFELLQAMRWIHANAERYLQHGCGHITSFLLRGGAIEAAIALLDREVDNGPETQPSG